jgi:hypothetical protein
MYDISRVTRDEDDILGVRKLMKLCFCAKFVPSNQQFQITLVDCLTLGVVYGGINFFLI